MVTCEIGKVILHAEVRIVHGVVPGEQLISESHVVFTILEYVDERELVGGASSGVVKLGIGDEQLVRQVVAETAVEVERQGAHEVVH